jgi:hypothetical protein
MRWLVVLALLAGCAHDAPPIAVAPRVVAFPARSPVPAVIDEAVRVQKDAAHVARTRDDLSTKELLRMLVLSDALQNAVRRVKAHRTPANIAAVRRSIGALREFTRRAP